MKEMDWEGVRKHLRLPYVLFILVLLADWLFFAHPLGWTLGIYGAVVALALLLRARPRFHTVMLRILLVLLIPAMVLVWRTDGVTVAVLGVMLVALTVAAGGGAPDTLAGWPLALARIPTRFWRYLDRRLLHLGGPRRLRIKKATPGLVRDWILPLGFTLVFVILFSQANPVYSSWIQRGIEWMKRQFYEWLDPLRWIFWVVIALACWCLLRYRARRTRDQHPWIAFNASADPVLPLGRTLGLFNIVFAVQNLLDVRYLLHGVELPAGMTYAQYAHRGAYLLVVTALLAGFFILLLFPPGRDGADSRIVRGLLHGWIAQNIILTMAAVWRLWLYVGAYGLTRLRVAAAFWILLVATGLLLAGVRLGFRHTTEWLVRANYVALSVVLLIWMLVNVDGRVARFNVQHCRERSGAGVSIDLAYLENLGPAALPALDILAQGDLPADLAHRLHSTQKALETQLVESLANWRGWTIQRHRLSLVYSAYANEGGELHGPAARFPATTAGLARGHVVRMPSSGAARGRMIVDE